MITNIGVSNSKVFFLLRELGPTKKAQLYSFLIFYFLKIILFILFAFLYNLFVKIFFYLNF